MGLGQNLKHGRGRGPGPKTNKSPTASPKRDCLARTQSELSKTLISQTDGRRNLKEIQIHRPPYSLAPGQNLHSQAQPISIAIMAVSSSGPISLLLLYILYFSLLCHAAHDTASKSISLTLS